MVVKTLAVRTGQFRGWGYISLWWLIACAAETSDGAACLEPLSTDCSAVWSDYNDIYDNLIVPHCGGPGTGSSCHGAEGLKAGLDLSDRERAYQSLLGELDGHARVIPGNPECSELVRRLEATDPTQVMPPGRQRPAEQRCSIVRWIADGAQR